jgi:hypothetical protein
MEGRVDLVARLLSAEPLCLGYQPVCGDNPFFEGAFFSILCHDEVPFVEPSRLTGMAGGEPGFQEAYVASPYLDVCEAWDVGEATSVAHRPVSSDIPMLIYVGVRRTALSRTRSRQPPRLRILPRRCALPGTQRARLARLLPEHPERLDRGPASPPETGCIEEIGPPTFEAS